MVKAKITLIFDPTTVITVMTYDYRLCVLQNVLWYLTKEMPATLVSLLLYLSNDSRKDASYSVLLLKSNTLNGASLSRQTYT